MLYAFNKVDLEQGYKTIGIDLDLQKAKICENQIEKYFSNSIKTLKLRHNNFCTSYTN